MSCKFKDECPSYTGWCEGTKQDFSQCVSFLINAIQAEREKHPKVFYLCDKRACDECHGECEYTEDIRHARNFSAVGIKGETAFAESSEPFLGYDPMIGEYVTVHLKTEGHGICSAGTVFASFSRGGKKYFVLKMRYPRMFNDWFFFVCVPANECTPVDD